MAKTLSIADLRRELAAREKQVARVRAQRDKVARRLAGIDRKIAALGGELALAVKCARKRPAKKRKRARDGLSLGDVLAHVLVGKGNVKPADAAKLALGAGYKTESSQFSNIVIQTLSTDRRFRRVTKGIYTLKGKPGLFTNR